MSEQVNEFKKEVTDFEKNKEKGVGYIHKIDTQENNEGLELTVELMHGEEKLKFESDNPNETIRELFTITDAEPPCIDDLIGEQLPVLWNEYMGEWDLVDVIPSLNGDNKDVGKDSWSIIVLETRILFLIISNLSLSLLIPLYMYDTTAFLIALFILSIIAIDKHKLTLNCIIDTYNGDFKWQG